MDHRVARIATRSRTRPRRSSRLSGEGVTPIPTLSRKARDKLRRKKALRRAKELQAQVQAQVSSQTAPEVTPTVQTISTKEIKKDPKDLMLEQIVSIGNQGLASRYSVEDGKTIFVDKMVHNMALMLTSSSDPEIDLQVKDLQQMKPMDAELDLDDEEKETRNGLMSSEMIDIPAFIITNTGSQGHHHFGIVIFDPLPVVASITHNIGVTKDWVQEYQKRNLQIYFPVQKDIQRLPQLAMANRQIAASILVHMTGIERERECTQCTRQSRLGKKQLVGCISFPGILKDCCSNCLFTGHYATGRCSRMDYPGKRDVLIEEESDDDVIVVQASEGHVRHGRRTNLNG